VDKEQESPEISELSCHRLQGEIVLSCGITSPTISPFIACAIDLIKAEIPITRSYFCFL